MPRSPAIATNVAILRFTATSFEELDEFLIDGKTVNAGLWVGAVAWTVNGPLPRRIGFDGSRPESLAESLSTLLTVLEVLEGDARYLNRNPKCEPQLGRRGLMSGTGGEAEKAKFEPVGDFANDRIRIDTPRPATPQADPGS